jgi:hypothetical protein
MTVNSCINSAAATATAIVTTAAAANLISYCREFLITYFYLTTNCLIILKTEVSLCQW